MLKQSMLVIVMSMSFGRISAIASTTLIGSFAFPPSKKPRPTLSTYYKGSKIAVTEGTFSCKEHPSVQDFFMLFTLESIMPQSLTDNPNTIEQLLLPAHAHYRCFKITKRNTLLSADHMWNIKELSLPVTGGSNQTMVIKIPAHTFVFLINPDFIATLEQEPWSSDAHALKLPKITFKPSVTAQDLHDTSITTCLASLDLEPFHKKPTVIKDTRTQCPHIVISMTE
jgi:hypothetical protein